MDYKAFYDDVLVWIQKANQTALQHGMESQTFWMWVASSAGAMCKKYQDNLLVRKQMMMLVEWLEEIWESRRDKA